MKDIAIIGVAGRFPEAASLEEFRRNLAQGRDSVRELSPDRRSATTLAPDKAFMEIGFIEDIDKFDHRFFNISKAEAEHMDPHQRLLMEVVYTTIESAGYDIDFFNGTSTALFIGDTEQEYYRLAERFDPTLVTGSTSAATAGRISRFFNFRGNAAMVDTACSSSLLALHLACNELITGDADYALACGVRIILFPDEKDTAPALGIMSADGKTRSFSAKADGSGAGEAVGAVLLKPLDRALADEDIIYAVIKGVAVNQDAQLSGSLTAPSSQAQAEVIKKAWEKGRIDPPTVSYIEAHGSGTKLGDPIEIAGIDLAFKGLTTDKHFCAASSVKSNIGHTGGAAGMSGLVKAVLSLRYRELYPSVHFDQPNPFIDFKNSTVYVNNAYGSWDAPFPRRAGISSFGLSGTNCHVVLEEAPLPGPAGRGRDSAFIFNFSAKSAASLVAYIKNFLGFIAQPGSPSLADISYTLNRGRKHYPHRLSVIASSREELAKELTGIVSNTAPQTGHQAAWSAAHEPVKKVIFLFSGDSLMSDQLMTAVTSSHPDVRKHIEACAVHYRVPGTTGGPLYHSNPAVNRFVLQYALYRFLEERGLTTDHLLGIGNGDLVVAAILNELSLAEAIERCMAEDANEPHAAREAHAPHAAAPPGLDKKLTSLVERECAEGRVAFIELGPPGCLSRGLQQLNYPDKEFMYSVIQLESSPLVESPPLGIIQALYLQQFPIDWIKFYAGTGYRRAALPGYAFEKVRCWLREPLSQEPPAPSNTEPAPVRNSPPTREPGAHAHIAIIPGHWSEMEKTIGAIWIEVLKPETLSLEDDFFRLGGHSLMATRVISIIEKKFGIRLVFKDIFTFATIRALAKGVGELIANSAQRSTYTDIQPAPAQASYLLSEAQRRLWLIHQANGSALAYNLPSALLLDGVLDVDRLEAAFRALIGRHESLRTSFREKNARPVQVIHDEVSFSIQRVTGKQEPDQILKEFLRPFDLAYAPLMRVWLAALQPGRHLLLLDMHHIISDGISMTVFSSELIRLYQGEELPPLRVQYKDFAVWQQASFANGLMQQQEQFWLQQFASRPPQLQLPTDKPRPKQQSFNGDKVVFELAAGQVQKIHSLAAATGTTPFMVLLAAFNILLHKYTGQEDITIGSPIAGRSHTDLDNIVGMFVNTLALRNRPAPEKTFLQFLSEVKDISLNAYEHQDYPFALLVDKLNHRKDPSRSPLFDVLFVHQNMEAPETQFDGLSVSSYPVNTGSAQFDLLLEVHEREGAWPARWEYSTDLFEEESILLMKERFLALLQDMLTDPGKTIGELSARIEAETIHTTTGLDMAFNF